MIEYLIEENIINKSHFGRDKEKIFSTLIAHKKWEICDKFLVQEFILEEDFVSLLSNTDTEGFYNFMTPPLGLQVMLLLSDLLFPREVDLLR